MIHQLDINGKDKVQVAKERLKTYEPKDGYYIAFSGGKDSCTIKALADMAGVKYDAHYTNTGIDPPELVRFIIEQHPDVHRDIPRDKDGNRITMWNLIPKKKMPPTRIVRYCCSALKEDQGEGRFVVTGVRRSESVKRKKSRHMVEDHGVHAANNQLNFTENLEDAPQFKICPQKHRYILNPIIDWSTEEVWEFLKENNIPYCKLYDEGKKRLGCIGCPMQGGAGMLKDFEKYPRYRKLYMVAFEKMLIKRDGKGKGNWNCPNDVMKWWTQS